MVLGVVDILDPIVLGKMVAENITLGFRMFEDNPHLIFTGVRVVVSGITTLKNEDTGLGLGLLHKR